MSPYKRKDLSKMSLGELFRLLEARGQFWDRIMDLGVPEVIMRNEKRMLRDVLRELCHRFEIAEEEKCH